MDYIYVLSILGAVIALVVGVIVYSSSLPEEGK